MHPHKMQSDVIGWYEIKFSKIKKKNSKGQKSSVWVQKGFLEKKISKFFPKFFKKKIHNFFQRLIALTSVV